MKRQTKTKDKMRQRSLFVDERSLFEQLCDLKHLEAGFKAVRKNGGSSRSFNPTRHASEVGSNDETD
jgi:hypothetical protein